MVKNYLDKIIKTLRKKKKRKMVLDMCKIINLKEYKKAKESDIELLKNAVKNFPYSSKEVEEQCNYYLERYLKNQSNKGCY